METEGAADAAAYPRAIVATLLESETSQSGPDTLASHVGSIQANKKHSTGSDVSWVELVGAKLQSPVDVNRWQATAGRAWTHCLSFCSVLLRPDRRVYLETGIIGPPLAGHLFGARWGSPAPPSCWETL